MRLEMLQVARLAPKLLLDARDLVADFVRTQLHESGGFIDRAGNPDLYYTVFGLECLLALREDLPREKVAGFLREFGDGEGLDFVHIGCLARCWAALQIAPALAGVPAHSGANATPGDPGQGPGYMQILASRLEAYRAKDGGFSQTKNDSHGSVYGCFLAVSAYQDLKLEAPNLDAIAACVLAQRCADGGFSNGRDLPLATTPTTAAAVTLLRVLQQRQDQATGDWLLARAHPAGGFNAIADAPMPDLLSTAVALHALSGMRVPIDSIKDSCLDFIDSLWVNKGSFYGNWSEDMLDVEYTYYALLALGHLSL